MAEGRKEGGLAEGWGGRRDEHGLRKLKCGMIFFRRVYYPWDVPPVGSDRNCGCSCLTSEFTEG